jgi:hypothetical protein
VLVLGRHRNPITSRLIWIWATTSEVGTGSEEEATTCGEEQGGATTEGGGIGVWGGARSGGTVRETEG